MPGFWLSYFTYASSNHRVFKYTFLAYMCWIPCCRFTVKNLVLLSHPLLLWLLGEYWFCLSRCVYDLNRPLAPILRQSQCTLMYEVYWLALMVMVFLYNGTAGSKYLEYNQDQNWIFSCEQWTTNELKAKESKRTKVKQRTNENRITNKINE